MGWGHCFTHSLPTDPAIGLPPSRSWYRLRTSIYRGIHRRCLLGHGPPPGVAAAAGLPVGLGAAEAARLAQYGRLAAVPALAEFPGSLRAFLCIEPLVLYALWTLVPGRGCFLMGAVAVVLGDAAFRLLEDRWSRRSGFWCSILAGTSCFGAVPFALGSARQGLRRSMDVGSPSHRETKLAEGPAQVVPAETPAAHER